MSAWAHTIFQFSISILALFQPEIYCIFSLSACLHFKQRTASQGDDGGGGGCTFKMLNTKASTCTQVFAVFTSRQ